ncbi:hypothetical protein LJR225_004235 [Phenylobacterium sp. LjRoot225]|uniref:hypothetical protein n=1 Tax=Phenylobacterium sp. LjRoot225 TaxID=3342285 RepID=UPI003ECE2DB7
METALERELLGLETQFWNAMKTKDIDAALRLTDEPCIVTGAQGVERQEELRPDDAGRRLAAA